MPPHLLKALAAQAAGTILTFSLARNDLLPFTSPLALAFSQGLLSMCAARILVSPRWWLYIHLFFAPALVCASLAKLPPSLYATLFALLALVYWSSFRTQVPLFLSNKITVHRLATHLPDASALKILDAGSGTGSFVRRMAKLRPDWHIYGLESAPIPFLVSRWLSRNQPNATLVRSDLWKNTFHDYDVVYAFLSPVPMHDLWRKAKQEMKPGALLISNSFPVPGQKPDRLIQCGDRRNTCLYCYEIAPHASSKQGSVT